MRGERERRIGAEASSDVVRSMAFGAGGIALGIALGMALGLFIVIGLPISRGGGDDPETAPPRLARRAHRDG